KRYLKEFLNDPRVIDLPTVKRKLLVNGIIVPFRAPKSAKIYKTLWELGNGESPLLTHSNNLREKLDKSLDKSDVFLAMRYGNPSMDVVLEEIRSKKYERIIILPLYPQYASASSGSCIDKALKIIKRWWVIPEITVIGQFYN